MTTATDKGIFINGKKQIIEMLQFMDNNEKSKLLENLKVRNPAMAKELTEKSFSFGDIFNLNESFLSKVLNSVNPTILGLAIYSTNQRNQKLALKLINRNNAEKAFHIMSQDLSSKKVECYKAQQRIVNYAINLSRNKQITL